MAICRTCCHRVSAVLWTVVLVLASSPLLFAQSPWERAASNLEIAFTGPIARSLALVAIVIGGSHVRAFRHRLLNVHQLNTPALIRPILGQEIRR